MLDSVVGTFLTRTCCPPPPLPVKTHANTHTLNLTAAFPGARSRAYFTHNSTALARQREVQGPEQGQGLAWKGLDSGQGQRRGEGTWGQGAGARVAGGMMGAEVAHAVGVSHWIPEGEDIVDWEAVRRAPADQLAELIRCRWGVGGAWGLYRRAAERAGIETASSAVIGRGRGDRRVAWWVCG